MARYDVDYPHVRQHADIKAILAHYNVKVRGDGEQRKGCCPFHEDQKSSLNVNVQKNLFKSHSCGSGGNVIKLVHLLDPKFENPRKAALHIAHLSGIAAKPNGQVGTAATSNGAKHSDTGTKEKAVEEEPHGGSEVAEDGITSNRPLTFTLQLAPIEAGKGTPANTFIDQYNIGYERLAELGIGLGQRGSMKDRLAIPILNQDQELVAYCGRDIGLLADAKEPTYKIPPKFRKEFELYGWDDAQNFDRVVLVESFLSVIKHCGAAANLSKTNFGMAAVMGTSISDQQIDLLREIRPEIIICFDGDEAGQKGAQDSATRLANVGLWVTCRNSEATEKPYLEDNEVFCRRCGKS